MKIRMEDGLRYIPKPDDKVECLEHGIVTTWAALDPIQQLALTEGIDTTPDLQCLYAPARSNSADHNGDVK